jgi:hypothetical protein
MLSVDHCINKVYVPDTSLLEEYVLNDTGKIYTGNRKQINGKRWNFGQVILIKDGQILFYSKGLYKF